MSWRGVRVGLLPLIMGGRIPLSPGKAEIPLGLDQVVVGPATAAEIGWTPRK